MDRQWFDTIVRRVTVNGPSRRQVLKGLTGSVFAGVLGLAGASKAAAEAPCCALKRQECVDVCSGEGVTWFANLFSCNPDTCVSSACICRFRALDP
jgi:hypothetical protein